MRFLTFFFILGALMLVSAKPSEKKKIKLLQHECEIAYLKDIDHLGGEKHMTIYSSKYENATCDNVIENAKNLEEEAMRNLVNSDEEFKQHSDCIIEKLLSFGILDAYLEKKVYKNDQTMQPLRKNTQLAEVYASIDTKFTMALELCAPGKMFVENFDGYFAEDSTPANETESEEEAFIGDLQEDYCQRKFFVDKKFVDLASNPVELNPKKIETDNLDCDTIWNETDYEYMMGVRSQFVDAFGETDSKTIRCFWNTFREGNYTAWMMRPWMLNEMKITSEQKETERAAFIDFNKKIYEEAMKCRKTEDDK